MVVFFADLSRRKMTEGRLFFAALYNHANTSNGVKLFCLSKFIPVLRGIVAAFVPATYFLNLPQKNSTGYNADE